jgi:hypothetical protein
LNKKQKILTAVSLAVFSAIIAGHYFDVHHGGGVWQPLTHQFSPEYRTALVDDVNMPLFVLAVFYAGLFFMMRDKSR